MMGARTDAPANRDTLYVRANQGYHYSDSSMRSPRNMQANSIHASESIARRELFDAAPRSAVSLDKEEFREAGS